MTLVLSNILWEYIVHVSTQSAVIQNQQTHMLIRLITRAYITSSLPSTHLFQLYIKFEVYWKLINKHTKLFSSMFNTKQQPHLRIYFLKCCQKLLDMLTITMESTHNSMVCKFQTPMVTLICMYIQAC